MRDFRDLAVWQKAHQFVLDINEVKKMLGAFHRKPIANG